MIVLTDGYDLARWKTSEVAGEILSEHEWTWEAIRVTSTSAGSHLQRYLWSDCPAAFTQRHVTRVG
jgi:hypothetical protein